MKIAIFGGSGATGKYVIGELLKQKDIEINALVRNTNSLKEFDSTRINLIQGDILNISNIDKTINGTNIVIYLIGHKKDSIEDLQSKSIENILNLMDKYNIKKLICLTGAGVFLSGDKPTYMDKILTFFIKNIAKKRFQDGKNMVEKIMCSKNIDWTIIRTQIQKSKKGSGNEQIGLLGDSGQTWKCSRDFIARFIVNCLFTKEYNQKYPVISD